MDPKKIYTRRRPNPEPIASMVDPEKLLHKIKERTIDFVSHMDKNLSLPKDRVKALMTLTFI